MPERIVLLGTTEGSWCGIQEVRRPVLRVRGLEGVLGVQLVDLLGAKYTLSISKEGDHPLPNNGSTLTWVRVSSSKPSRSLICLIVPAAKAA